ncbi:MAG: benzoate/H(+) symporter BenE family transporter, partial [Thiolinea sp.]
MLKQLSLHHLTAGFVAVLVGFTSSVAIVFQAAQAAGATPSQITSWLLALGIGMAFTSGVFSWLYRQPVLTAWSTPGAALLATSLVGISLPEATGIFIFAAVLTIVFGLTGWFERISQFIPLPIASAMLAGVLFRFGLDVFVSMQHEFTLVLLMFLSYLLAKRFVPRYAIMLVLLIGLGFAGTQGMIQFDALELKLATPEFVMPVFNWVSMLSVGVPLFIVTMTSQNLPGIAVMKANGFHPPLSPIITWTGIATLVLAPFGGFMFNLAAITAAICMGKEADEDPDKRYLASLSASLVYLIVGLFGATIVVLFTALPQALILSIAGLALLSTIANGLHTALADESEREAALITFLVTASGMALWGIGAAFWGLIAGILARWIFMVYRGN